MQTYYSYLMIYMISLFLCFCFTFKLIALLKFFRIFDIANGRSCHFGSVPVGGGLAILLTVLPAWLILNFFLDFTVLPVHLLFAVQIIIVALVFWIDDLVQLSPIVRLLVQFCAVAVMLCMIPQDERVFGNDWPWVLDRVLAAVCWVWFINLFNFMDGIDGLAATETIFVAVGLVLLSLSVAFPSEYQLLAVLLAGAVSGFLYFNWQPAKLFLGDVGSISIGFILGWLLIQLAVAVHLLAAFMLPAFFLADATITISKRILNRKRFWRPHREHFYQQAVLSGFHSHASAVLLIGAANVLLLLAAFVSLSHPLLAMVIALCVLAFAIYGLVNPGRNMNGHKVDEKTELPPLRLRLTSLATWFGL